MCEKGPCLDWDKCTRRGEWCQIIPKGHNEDVCHNVSVKRRNIICEMKRLVNEAFKKPVCDQWDTVTTLNNTKGPYRFGKIDPSKQHQELIGSQLIHRCDCGKRNGLQDDCRRWNCRGSPPCKEQPFPKCGPFLGRPNDRTVPAYDPTPKCARKTFEVPEICPKCDVPTIDTQ